MQKCFNLYKHIEKYRNNKNKSIMLYGLIQAPGENILYKTLSQIFRSFYVEITFTMMHLNSLSAINET